MAEQVHNDFDLNSYIGLIRASTLASGFIFELPIIIYFLTKIGLVTPEFLRKNRKYALVIVIDFCGYYYPARYCESSDCCNPRIDLISSKHTDLKTSVKKPKKKRKKWRMK